MGNIGATEIILILIIALVVFGPRRLPQIGRTVGKSLREFRKASQDIRDELHFSLDDDEPPMVRSQPVPQPDRPPVPAAAGPEGQTPVAKAKPIAAKPKPTAGKAKPTAGKAKPTAGTKKSPAKPRAGRPASSTARKREQPA